MKCVNQVSNRKQYNRHWQTAYKIDSANKFVTLGTRQAHGMGRHGSWHLCWVAHRSDCQRSMLSCKQGSSEQDCKVWHAICLSHCLPVAVETAGTWNQSAIELIQEIGRRITAVTEDTRETVFLFQRLSVALHRGMRSPSGCIRRRVIPRRVRCFC